MSEDERLPAQGGGGYAGSKIIRDTKVALGLISALIVAYIAQWFTWAYVAPSVVAVALLWVVVLVVRAYMVLGAAIRNLNEILNFMGTLLKAMQGDGVLISLLTLACFNGGAFGVKATSEEIRKREVHIIFHGADTSTVSSIQSTVVVDPVNPTVSFSILQPEVNVTSFVTINFSDKQRNQKMPDLLTASDVAVTIRCCSPPDRSLDDLRTCWNHRGMSEEMSDTDVRKSECPGASGSTGHYLLPCGDACD